MKPITTAMNTVTLQNHPQLAQAVTAAEALLAARLRIQDGIRVAESSMQALFARRMQLEDNLAHAEAAASLGEPSDASKVQQALIDLQAEMDMLSSRRDGLSGRLAEQEPELSQVRKNLETYIPPFRDEILQQFNIEYKKALADFERILSKGDAIAQVLNCHVEMSAPRAAAELPNLGDTARPGFALAGLRGALNQIRGTAELQLQQSRRNARARTGLPVAPDAILRLLKPFRGFAVGQLVGVPLLSISDVQYISDVRIAVGVRAPAAETGPTRTVISGKAEARPAPTI